MEDLLNGDLRPVSNEEMERILKEESNVLTSGSGSGSGLGSGSGSGSGSGCGCGSGSGSGCGSGKDEGYENVPSSDKGSSSYRFSYKVNYAFTANCNVNFYAYAERHNEKEQWQVHITRVLYTFSINGETIKAGKDEKGNDIKYITSGGSKSFDLAGSADYHSCEIDCRTESPEFRRLIAQLSAGFSTNLDESTGKITMGYVSLNCIVNEK